MPHSSSLSSVASGGELANRMGLVSGAQKADLMSRPCPVSTAYRLPVRGAFFTGVGTLWCHWADGEHTWGFYLQQEEKAQRTFQNTTFQKTLVSFAQLKLWSEMLLCFPLSGIVHFTSGKMALEIQYHKYRVDRCKTQSPPRSLPTQCTSQRPL